MVVVVVEEIVGVVVVVVVDTTSSRLLSSSRRKVGVFVVVVVVVVDRAGLRLTLLTPLSLSLALSDELCQARRKRTGGEQVMRGEGGRGKLVCKQTTPNHKFWSN